MLKKTFAFAAQPNAHFRVKLLEAHYDSYGDKTAEDTHLTNHLLRKKIRAFDSHFVPLDIHYRTDYEDGRIVSEESLKLTLDEKKMNVKSALKNCIVYEGGKRNKDFVETIVVDGVKKKRRTKMTRPVYFEYKGHKLKLSQEQSLVDCLVVQSFAEHPEVMKRIVEKGYNVFSDRRFLPHKSGHSMADTMALIIALIKEGNYAKYEENLDLLIKAREYH
jgi:hypothetical protein